MTKALCKEIMHRSKFKNIFNKNPDDENKRLYKRQRNICLSLLRKEKKNYYNNLDSKGNIDEIIKQYETHLSIQNIKENITLGETFVFSDTIPEDISKRILDPEPRKASVENSC